MNENLSDVLFNALGNTVVGFGLVFAVLMIILVIIYCFKFISMAEKALTKNKPEEVKKTAPKTAEATTVASASLDDAVITAVISAAIYAYSEESGYPVEGLFVRSIKRRF